MFVGNGARVLIEESLKVSGDPKASRIEEGMKIYGRIFDQNCTYHVTPYEGIPEMLKALKDRGIHLAVLSNKKSLEITFLTMHRDKKTASAENQNRTESGI